MSDTPELYIDSSLSKLNNTSNSLDNNSLNLLQPDWKGFNSPQLLTLAGETLIHAWQNQTNPTQALVYAAGSIFKNNFAVNAQIAFGEAFNINKAEALGTDILGGNYGVLPDVQFLSNAQMNSALGAYAKSNNTIYLNSVFLTQNSTNPTTVGKVLVEESGHFLDVYASPVDSPGDEGEILAELILGKQLSADRITKIRAEDDTAIIVVNGQKLGVEQSRLPTITMSANDTTAGETLAGQPTNPGQFTLTRTENTASALTVNYTVGGTAINGTDYNKLSNSVTFASGSSTSLINISPIDDREFEGNETVVLTLATNINYNLGTTTIATVIIADNDKPTITISANDANAGETLAGQPTNPGQFTLTRTGSTASALTVNYMVGGTATNGTDYSTLTNSVTFGAGASAATINLNSIDDVVIENDETVVLNLASSTNYNLGAVTTTTVIIADNDKPNITVTNPNGGNSLQAGSSYNITWSDNIAENVKIDLFKGTIFYSTLFGSTPSDGNEVWTVPSNLTTVSDYYQIKISSISNSNVYDWGNNYFTIAPAPYITVTSPNGGNSLQAGNSYNITWNDNISENVKIDLYKAGNFYSTLFSSTTSDGSETWTLPSNLASGSDYKIKITSVNNGNLFDFGDANFTINSVPSDYAGNSLTQARNIGTLSSTQYFSDFVGDADPNDYYKFSVSSPSNFNLSLSGLSGNADIQLIQDINGNSQIDANEILGSSILTGSSAESISAPLFSGNYYVRIYPSGNSINSNYNLSLSATSLGNYDYTDPSPNNNSYYNLAVTRSFFNSSGISVYQSQYGTFIMYGSIADYYTNNQYANNNTTNGLFGIYSGLGLPTSAIYKKDDGSFVMEFEGGTLTNRNGIVTPSYNQKASSFALVGQGAPDGTELQWKNDYIYWSKNSVGNPTGSVRHVTGGWIQEFTGSPKGDGDSIFFVKDGQQLTQGGPYRVQGWMLDIYRLTGGYERQNGGLGFATQVTEQSNVNGYKHYHTFENGFIGITADNKIAIKNWQGQLINVVGYDGVAINSTYRNTFNRDGGTASLGSPINNVHSWGNGYIQDFTGGSDGNGAIMKSNANDNSYWVGGDFWNKFLEAGGAGGILYYPTSDRYSTINGALRQDFQGGAIIKSDKGIFTLYGGIGSQYLQVESGEKGRLGLPTSGEIGIGNGVVVQNFEKGRIVWNDGLTRTEIYGQTPSQPPQTGGSSLNYGGKVYQWTSYTIKSGDSLSAIAQRALGDANGYSVIAQRNAISNPNKINAGQVIEVPLLLNSSNPPVQTPSQPPQTGGSSLNYGGKVYQWTSYTIKSGDSLSAIAQRALGDANGYSVIAQRNAISNPNKINAGQVIEVPLLLNSSNPNPQPTPTPNSGSGNSSGDKAGNTLNDALSIGTLVSNRVYQYSDRVNATDINDYYVFSINTRSNVKIRLSGIIQNAAIQLIKKGKTANDIYGNIILDSRKPELQEEFINTKLGAGTYYIRVVPEDIGTTKYTLADTKYDLSVSATSLSILDVAAQYEKMAKNLIYNDYKKGDIIYGESFDTSYKVEIVFGEPGKSGFYALGLDPLTRDRSPILLVRGSQPTDIKDVLTDLNPFSVGYNQFLENKSKIEDWLRLKDAQGVKPDVIGHSLGGAIAQQITYFFPQLVSETVTFNSPGISYDKYVRSFSGDKERITHFVVKFDVVSLGGEAFLPGKVFVSLGFGKTSFTGASEADLLKNHLETYVPNGIFREETNQWELHRQELGTKYLESLRQSLGYKILTLFKAWLHI